MDVSFLYIHLGREIADIDSFQYCQYFPQHCQQFSLLATTNTPSNLHQSTSVRLIVDSLDDGVAKRASQPREKVPSMTFAATGLDEKW